MRLRLGITDGQQTELIQALDGELKDGTEVVTNVITGAVRQAPTPPGGAGFPGLGGGRQGASPAEAAVATEAADEVNKCPSSLSAI